jgi:hypothetical protein
MAGTSPGMTPFSIELLLDGVDVIAIEARQFSEIVSHVISSGLTRHCD